MAQTKLQILSEYTPDHPGPFCTREKVPVELMYRNGRAPYRLGGYIGDSKELSSWSQTGGYYAEDQCLNPKDLMNAVEVPVAREFWINETQHGSYIGIFSSEEAAVNYKERDGNQSLGTLRTIHVREVLPGES